MLTHHPLLAPYQPSAGDPFDAVKAAHLLNRAGFGGTPQEIEHVRAIGPQAAVDELLDFPDLPAEEQNPDDVPDLSAIAGIPKTFRDLQLQLAGKTPDEQKTLRMAFNMANNDILMAAMQWWMNRMAHGPSPLQEKLALFWHGHFTTSAKDERMAALMWNQNELLRRHAAGNFGKMVHAISRDPAMLDYLNNTQNRKEHANENYARELMELFTLGIGHYSENDVKQGARAFTGWSHDGDQYIFRAPQHDYGVKSYLGHIGDFNGDDVVNIILQTPACAPFISTEIYRWFVADEVDPKLAEAMASILRDNNYELRPLLRTILSSRVFYASQTIGAQIKCPVQLVVGSARLLDVTLPPQRAVVATLTQMGQVPFMPPNVRGWMGGRTWINTGTIFARYNAGVWLTGGDSSGFLKGRLRAKDTKIVDSRPGGQDSVQFDPAQPAHPNGEQIVDDWLARLIQRPVDPAQRSILIDALKNRDDVRSIRNLVQLITAMPEYQLC